MPARAAATRHQHQLRLPKASCHYPPGAGRCGSQCSRCPTACAPPTSARSCGWRRRRAGGGARRTRMPLRQHAAPAKHGSARQHAARKTSSAPPGVGFEQQQQGQRKGGELKRQDEGLVVARNSRGARRLRPRHVAAHAQGHQHRPPPHRRQAQHHHRQDLGLCTGGGGRGRAAGLVGGWRLQGGWAGCGTAQHRLCAPQPAAAPGM